MVSQRPSHFAWLYALLALAAFMAGAACDGGADSSSGGSTRGGSITISQTAQPDALDPALSFALGGWEPMWLVYTPLLTYRHAAGRAGTELMPGLAEELPEISSDGRIYRLRLRKGLRFSDGTQVRARDFEHSIRRVINLESPGASFFQGIVGASEYLEAGEAEADIAGIRTNDRTREVAIELTAQSATFEHVLAMNFAGLVPSSTPFRNMTTDPPPGVGAYVITESEPNRRFVLERNRRFGIPGIPRGRLDRVTTTIVGNLERQTQDVIRGRLDYMHDPPATSLLPEVRRKYGDRYREFATPATLYFFLNTAVEPFDDRRVREAANHALDKAGISRLLGGLVELGCVFLPPEIPGHEELAPCPWGKSGGRADLEAARRLISESGAAGEEVKVWGPSEEPARSVTIAYADMLHEIGLDAEPVLLAFAAYLQVTGDHGNHAQAGFLSYSEDFPHPADFLAQFSGEHITPINNLNRGNVDDPRLNASIARLSAEADLAAAADDWAEVDQMLIEKAYVATVGHPKRTTFMSERMDFEHCSLVHPVYGHDYSSFCFK